MLKWKVWCTSLPKKALVKCDKSRLIKTYPSVTELENNITKVLWEKNKYGKDHNFKDHDGYINKHNKHHSSGPNAQEMRSIRIISLFEKYNKK